MSPRTIIVTGAASGIGFACVKALLAQGDQVCAADINPMPQSLRVELDETRLLCTQVDVGEQASCEAAVAAAQARFGRIHGLIHMAATHSTSTWRDLSPEEFTRTLHVNVTGSFLMASTVARHMEQHGGGAIVLTSSGSISVSGIGGHGRGGPAYVSSKAAIIGLTRALARSLAPHKIRVNAVSPGATRTAMTADYDEEALRKVGERTLTGQIGRPDEIAAVALFLVSDAASYIDGEVVAANGGGSFGL